MMKTEKRNITTRQWAALVLVCLGASAIFSGCAATGDSGATYSYPDPAEKQYKMQEDMSRVTRSFIN